jgi:CBS domain-containing protein
MFGACERASARVDSRDAPVDSTLIVQAVPLSNFTCVAHNVTATRERSRAVSQTTIPQSPPAPTAVADIMQPPVTTVERYDHVAAAAYLMKHAGTRALMVLDALTDRLIGIITEADVAHAVADGKDVNEVRIHDVMTNRPTAITPATSIRGAAEVMISSHFQHLPVVGDNGLAGVVDIDDVCRALLIEGQDGPGTGRLPLPDRSQVAGQDAAELGT